MYADDLILITASLTNLQKLICLCNSELSLIGLTLNAKKSAFICVGKKLRSNRTGIIANNLDIPITLELRCLGTYLKSVKF